jgi:hypothetical protein
MRSSSEFLDPYIEYCSEVVVVIVFIIDFKVVTLPYRNKTLSNATGIGIIVVVVVVIVIVVYLGGVLRKTKDHRNSLY